MLSLLTGLLAGAPVPRINLPNGVAMPAMLLGVGTATWMNDTSTASDVKEGILAGFPGIDTASHYLNQRGVAAGIAASGVARSDLWLSTKVEGCGNSVTIPVRKGSCYSDTLAVINQNLAELNTSAVDLTLLHSPPASCSCTHGPQGWQCVANATWNEGCEGNPASDLIYPTHCKCDQPEPCAMIQQQWKALEVAYKAGHTRAIGVSNYCAKCLKCVTDVATVSPHVNMFKVHAGMGPDPAGLISATKATGAVVQAYQALAHGDHGLFHEPAVLAAAKAHGKSAAQVLIKWVLQLGLPVVTSATKVAYMKEDLDMWGWQMTSEEMQTLNQLQGHGDDPVGNMCVL